jgi:hypothetical protein
MLPHTFAQGFIIQMTSNVCTGSISAGESVKRVRAEHKERNRLSHFSFSFFKGFKGNKRPRAPIVSRRLTAIDPIVVWHLPTLLKTG